MISSHCHFLAIMLQNVKALKSYFAFESACKRRDGNTDPSHLLLVRRQYINPFLPFWLFPERTNPSSPSKVSFTWRLSHPPPITLTPHLPAEPALPCNTFLSLCPQTFSFFLRCGVFSGDVSGQCHELEPAQIRQTPGKRFASCHALTCAASSKGLTPSLLPGLSTDALAARRLSFNCTASAALQKAVNRSRSLPVWPTRGDVLGLAQLEAVPSMSFEVLSSQSPWLVR